MCSLVTCGYNECICLSSFLRCMIDLCGDWFIPLISLCPSMRKGYPGLGVCVSRSLHDWPKTDRRAKGKLEGINLMWQQSPSAGALRANIHPELTLQLSTETQWIAKCKEQQESLCDTGDETARGTGVQMRSFILLLISLTATKQLKQLPHYAFQVFADFIFMPRLQKSIAIVYLPLILFFCYVWQYWNYFFIFYFLNINPSLSATVTNTCCQKALHGKRESSGYMLPSLTDTFNSSLIYWVHSKSFLIEVVVFLYVTEQSTFW